MFKQVHLGARLGERAGPQTVGRRGEDGLARLVDDVPVRVVPVEAAAAVVAVDLALAVGVRIGPVVEPPLLDSPEARAGLEWVYNLGAKQLSFDNLYRDANKDQMFEQQGKLAMRTGTPGLAAEYRKPGQERVKFDLGIAMFPRGPKGHGTQASGSTDGEKPLGPSIDFSGK